MEVNTNIPITDKRHHRGRYQSEFKSDMEVGHSIFFEVANEKIENVRISAFNAAKRWTKINNLPWKWKTSVEPKGVRIWRLS